MQPFNFIHIFNNNICFLPNGIAYRLCTCMNSYSRSTQAPRRSLALSPENSHATVLVVVVPAVVRLAAGIKQRTHSHNCPYSCRSTTRFLVVRSHRRDNKKSQQSGSALHTNSTHPDTLLDFNAAYVQPVFVRRRIAFLYNYRRSLLCRARVWAPFCVHSAVPAGVSTGSCFLELPTAVRARPSLRSAIV